MNTKKALGNVLIYSVLVLIFNSIIYIFMGGQKAVEFFGGYIIEQSLSLDNLFLFLMIFEVFKIKSAYQKKVLNYGVIGAIILRLIFVMLGVTVVNSIHWVLYVFGAILIFSGIDLIYGKKDERINMKDNFILKYLNKIVPLTNKSYGEKFFVTIDNKIYATTLFAALVIIEFTDIIFAIDSIPAVFSITTDPFIVYTSNIFAVLCLRSMYFVLERAHEKFKYIKYGISLILIFTGIKLCVLMFGIQIPIITSIIIIAIILGSCIMISM